MLQNSPFVGEALAGSWRESDLLASARRKASPAHRTHDGIIVTPRPDEMWEIDSHAFQDELRFVGIRSSPLFIRSPGGNGCVERSIRTLKEQLLWFTHDSQPSTNSMLRFETLRIDTTITESSGVLATRRPCSTDAVSSWRVT